MGMLPDPTNYIPQTGELHQFWLSAIDALPAHIAILDDSGKILFVNASWRQYGWDNNLAYDNSGIGQNYLDICDKATGDSSDLAKDVAAGIRQVITQEIKEFGIEYPCHGPEQERWFKMNTTCFKAAAGRRVVISHEDITERILAENELALNQKRLSSLLELSHKAHSLSEHEIVHYVIEETVKLTNSKIGYLHFVNPDQKTLQLVTWSKETLNYCTADYASHYPIDQAGIWADCVRTGKPVVHNDYQKLEDKNGYPEGHAHLLRHASIPVYDGWKIKLILGVGNKSRDYDDSDLLQMTLIGDQLIRILQRKRVEDDLRIKESAIESSINAVAMADLYGNLTYVNKAFLEMWGYSSKAGVLGKSLVLFWADPALAARVIDTLKTEENWLGELIARKKDGSKFDAQLAASLVRNDDDQPISIMSSFLNITERKRYEAGLREANTLLEKQLAEIQKLQVKLREQAIRDSLTGLYNRRYLEAILVQELDRASRDDYPISLVMIDIDHFKKVNDTHGHKAGDQMLIILSRLLQEGARKGDTVCRYGGEEFMVLMPKVSSETAVKRAEEWRVAFEKTRLHYDKKSINATISAGIATFNGALSDIDEAIREADIALYRSKTSGRNRISISKNLST